ncbi:uncharacterized protein LOC132902415 [Amyelois transitella]|uniref:uncharacterized protein LOC132902415 n=1 Tax=Amyelois transitella TaxID=680683 RepID=UPI00298F65AD|nr:uncharacterized protein LOC132902415 [Amyelois transitella]
MNCHAMSQANVYYFPYPFPQYPAAAIPPYAVIIPNSTIPEILVTSTPFTITSQPITMTTRTASTSTAAPSTLQKSSSTVVESSSSLSITPDSRREAVIEVSDIYINENIRNNDAKYILTSLRRTKPYWQASGVVPIPNNLAEKLMTQMKDDTKRNRRGYRSN